MSITAVTIFDELQQRAGASDQDRDAWLAERRHGVTATEIRDLYLKRISTRELVNRKLGRTPEVGDLSHVPVIGWGNFREPVIAEIIQQRYGLLPESRVFRAADNARLLASPDGVGLDFDEQLVVAEIKTAGHDVSVGTDGYAEKGYGIQQNWVMRVIGARRSLYVWEERVEVAPGLFEPGEQHFEWIDYDETLAAELEEIALAFLAALDAATSDPEAEPVIDEHLDTLAVNVLAFRETETSAKKAKETAWQSLLGELVAGGEEFSQESLLARITFTPGSSGTTQVPDVEAAKKADPELFAEVEALSKRWNAHQALHQKTVHAVGKPSLTVTALKTKGKAA